MGSIPIACSKFEVTVADELPKFPIEVKRFYLPGYKVESHCPGCKKLVVRDMGNAYLSYPTANEPFLDHMYCPDCDSEWEVKLLLTVTLEQLS